MRLAQQVSRGRRGVSLVPLVDVVFILLLFFMLSSTFIQRRQVPMNVAVQAYADPTVDVVELRLLSNEGNVSINGESIEKAKVSSFLTGTEISKSAVIAIRTEPLVKVQALVTLLDSLKAADRKKVALVQ